MTRRPFSDIQGAAAIGAHVSKSLKGAKSFALKKPKKEKEKKEKDKKEKQAPAPKPPKKTVEKKRPITEGPKATHSINADTGKPVKLNKTQQKAVGSYYSREKKPYSSGGLGPVKKTK
jgi:hypothetical protein